MRRLPVLFLALLLIAALAGCGSSSTPVASNNPQPTPSPTGPTPNPSPSPPPPPSPAPGPQPGPPPVPAPPPAPSPTPPPAPSPTDITGKVVDTATAQPVNGTVYVALEELQPQDSNYHIIDQQQPDANGNFDFKNVTSTNLLMIVVTAMNNQDLFDDFYVPYVLASNDNAPNGNAQNITPGTDVGTLAIGFAPGPDAEELDVSLQSNTSSGGAVPITVNFTATTFQLDRHIDFLLPFKPEAANTQVDGPGCSAGTACGSGKVYLPTYAPTIQYYKGIQIQGNPPSYAVFANATLPNSTTPDCQPPTQEMDINASQPGQSVGTSLVFTGCN